MIHGRCPVCDREYAIAGLDDLPSFPFCSDRCRLIDLGRWLGGKYVIPGEGGEPAERDPAGEESGDG